MIMNMLYFFISPCCTLGIVRTAVKFIFLFVVKLLNQVK